MILPTQHGIFPVDMSTPISNVVLMPTLLQVPVLRGHVSCIWPGACSYLVGVGEGMIVLAKVSTPEHSADLHAYPFPPAWSSGATLKRDCLITQEHVRRLAEEPLQYIKGDMIWPMEPVLYP
ncbi:hypothetical protein BV22DRAFT_1040166 [Leucogyrophana mollusca]|uniref:Uncharacterized protein n=1 Tax=Leucogyrophana mollusca TaxID=85980 RepID=A0ACB8B3N5_9AGAM|nr:hypothetical protein BV22DRAFT_1040166 [Leucogyrophana mollusca]